MNLTRCAKGHYYDMDKFSTCPHCSNVSEGMGETVRYTQPAPGIGPGAGGPMMGGNINPGMNMGMNNSMGPTFGTPGANGDTPTVDYTKPTSDIADMINKSKNQANKDDEDSSTIAFGNVNAKTDVVGWVVIIDGDDKGKSFNLKTGRNFIGRNASQDVVLAKDKAVSREKHAIIVYEPRQRKFLVQPGDSRGLFYVNDNVVLGSEELKPYDVILVGKTQLAFIPFCGEKFSWENGIEKGE